MMNDNLHRLIVEVQNASEACPVLEEFVVFLDKFMEDAFPVVLGTGCNKLYAKALLLKMSNLFAVNFQYRQRHESLISFPYGLIVDPSNGCPLRCPGCLHNRVFQNKIHPDWPPGLLNMETYKKFLDQYGPYASIILFFNWGEPLLNKQTPEFIAMAKSYMLRTSISSNLSVEFDADAIVLSGLDHMTLSLDGITPETYGKYRHGGNLDLIVYNIQRLVSAKIKHRVSTPILSWQFLLFEHNKHEVDAAREMALRLGLDEIRFVHPYDVPWDQNIQVATEIEPQVYRFLDNPESITKQEERSIAKLSNRFNEIFAVEWAGRLKKQNNSNFVKRDGKTCRWLYTTTCMDALGRFLPCCYAPRSKTGLNYIFSEITDPRHDNFNSEYYRYSRRSFVESSEINRPGGQIFQLGEGQKAPYCVACHERFGEPLINKKHLKMYYERMGKFAGLDIKSVIDIVERE